MEIDFEKIRAIIKEEMAPVHEYIRDQKRDCKEHREETNEHSVKIAKLEAGKNGSKHVVPLISVFTSVSAVVVSLIVWLKK